MADSTTEDTQLTDDRALPIAIALAGTAETRSHPSSGGRRRDILRRDALSLGVDLAQHHQHLLGHDVARDALALRLELLHVDPYRIKRRGAPRDDAGMQQGLDQHAED